MNNPIDYCVMTYGFDIITGPGIVVCSRFTPDFLQHFHSNRRWIYNELISDSVMLCKDHIDHAWEFMRCFISKPGCTYCDVSRGIYSGEFHFEFNNMRLGAIAVSMVLPKFSPDLTMFDTLTEHMLWWIDDTINLVRGMSCLWESTKHTNPCDIIIRELGPRLTDSIMGVKPKPYLTRLIDMEAATNNDFHFRNNIFRYDDVTDSKKEQFVLTKLALIKFYQSWVDDMNRMDHPNRNLVENMVTIPYLYNADMARTNTDVLKTSMDDITQSNICSFKELDRVYKCNTQWSQLFKTTFNETLLEP